MAKNESGQGATPAQETTSPPAEKPKQITGEMTTEDRFEDPDDVALREARAAAEAEESAAGPLEDPEQDAVQIAQAAQGEQTPQPASQEGQTQQAPQAAPEAVPAPTGEDQGQQPAIPKARFDEAVEKERAARAKAEAEANYYRGVAETQAMQQAQPQAQPAQPAPPPPDYDAMLAEQDTAKRAAAKRFDDGEITMSDYVAVEEAVNANKRKIEAHRAASEERAREAEAAAEAAKQPREQTPTPGQQDSLADQLVLDQQLEQLDQANPYVPLLTPEHVERLRHMVISDMRAQGKVLPGGSHGTYILRAEIAKMAGLMGPSWFPDHNPAQAQPPQGQQPGQAGLSQTAQDRLAKVPMAGAMPPDTSQLGTGAGGGNPIPSDEQVAQMSDDDIALLPAEVRARWLGATT